MSFPKHASVSTASVFGFPRSPLKGFGYCAGLVYRWKKLRGSRCCMRTAGIFDAVLPFLNDSSYCRRPTRLGGNLLAEQSSSHMRDGGYIGRDVGLNYTWEISKE